MRHDGTVLRHERAVMRGWERTMRRYRSLLRPPMSPFGELIRTSVCLIQLPWRLILLS